MRHFSNAVLFFFEEHFEDVYDNLHALASYFNNPEDKWVRNHFYERCFEIAQRIKIDGGKKEAKAHAHMGLLFEEEGEWSFVRLSWVLWRIQSPCNQKARGD